MRILKMQEVGELLNPGACAFVHGTATEPRALVEHWMETPSDLGGVPHAPGQVARWNSLCPSPGPAGLPEALAAMEQQDV